MRFCSVRTMPPIPERDISKVTFSPVYLTFPGAKVNFYSYKCRNNLYSLFIIVTNKLFFSQLFEN